MDPNLLRSYLATVYDFPSPSGPIRASLDGDIVTDPLSLPELLQRPFAVLTAYNPRSMLLPRKVNEQRHVVMRDLLILGVYRVESCVGYEEDPEGTWREPSWLVHGNGLQVLRAVRAAGLTMPIIMLSARTGELDKVTGLELGAEDYVAKPFSLAELLARVRAALRRGPSAIQATPRSVLTFGDVRLDVAARTVARAGVPVEMTATEFDVLLCLIDARGVALTREAIFLRVWGPNHHGTPRTIDNFIQQLRAKLEPDPQKPRYVLTVRGIGYRFE